LSGTKDEKEKEMPLAMISFFSIHTFLIQREGGIYSIAGMT